MVLHRIQHQFAQLARSKRPWMTANIHVVNAGKSPRRRWSAANANALHMAGRKHPNTQPPGKRLRHVAPKIKATEGGWIALGVYWRAARECSRLRCKPKDPLALRYVKRL